MKPAPLPPLAALAATLAVGSFVVGLAAAPAPALAAHAGAPYTNVDRRNDAGNNTGDAQVDALNAAQLNQNYQPGMNERMMAAPPPPTTMAPPAKGHN